LDKSFLSGRIWREPEKQGIRGLLTFMVYNFSFIGVDQRLSAVNSVLKKQTQFFKG
jgi:hypothetical protein